MTIPRSGPYIWMSFLPALLSGDASCNYQQWFKTHNQIPSTYDALSQNAMAHTDLLNRETAALKALGFDVRRERQNYFNMKAPSYTLGGQPDLLTVNADGLTGTIHEAKSGAPRNAHQVQTILYMWALPRAFVMYQNVKFEGRVVYKDNEIAIPANAVDADFIKRMSDLIKSLVGSQPPDTFASPGECRWCRVPDCPDRADVDPSDGVVEMDDFDF